MPKIDLKYSKVLADDKYGKEYDSKDYYFFTLSKKQFASFNEELLGLGDLSLDGKYINGLAAFFDLEGFTEFCNQVDSHLVIPEFIQKYTHWIFNQISETFKEAEYDDHIKLWGSLPFYAKFLGDGILFLWDSDKYFMVGNAHNIVNSLLNVTIAYRNKFLPYIKNHVSKPPPVLRCGIARGQIISLGDGKDYVGSCINIASRLQKLSSLSFAVSRRGFNITDYEGHILNRKVILKKCNIVGIGDDELIYVQKEEFNSLPESDKLIFMDVNE